MSEDIFRLVVTVAVLLACIAFVVQAAVVIAFYKTVRKMQQKFDHMGDAIEPLIGKIEPVIEKVGPIIDRAGRWWSGWVRSWRALAKPSSE